MNYYKLYFIYTTEFVNVAAAAGAVGVATLAITADADFEAKYMTVTVRQANVVVVNWGGLVQVDDSGRGRTLFSQALAIDAIRGNGQLPYPFNPPRLFRRNSTVTITFTNNVATATEVQLALHGNKLLPESGETI